MKLKAQQSENYFKPPTSPILKFSPLSLIDMVNSIQFALEYHTFKHQSLQHELGYITNIFSDPDQNKNKEEIRFRNEYRFYLIPDKSNLGGFYVAPEILFIHLSYTKTGTFGRLCSDSNTWDCAYFEVMDYQIKKQVFAFHPKVGYQLMISRFALDFYGGLGYRHVNVWSRDKPPHQREWEGDFFNLKKNEGTYKLPSMSLGFKIGYVLKKRADENLPYYREDNSW